MTNQVEILSDESIREITLRYPQAADAIDNDTPPEVAAILGHIPALCATVKVLRAQLVEEVERADSNFTAYDRIKGYYSETVNRLSEVERERNELRDQALKLSAALKRELEKPLK